MQNYYIKIKTLDKIDRLTKALVKKVLRVQPITCTLIDGRGAAAFEAYDMNI